MISPGSDDDNSGWGTFSFLHLGLDLITALAQLNVTMPFKSKRQAQRFFSVHDQVTKFFHIHYPDHTTANAWRGPRERAFVVGSEFSKAKFAK